MLLSFVIITYILSVVIALVFLFTGKKLKTGWFRIIASIHLVTAVVFVFNLMMTKTEGQYYFSFLLFVCTGVVCCGLAYGTKAILPVKVYFSVFAFSFILFLLSPSTLFRFLLTAGFSNSKEQLILVKGNIYLEKQTSLFTNGAVFYKLIEKHGMFHKTILRDLNFNDNVDSIKVISLEDNNEVVIRAYTSKKTYVSDETDSLDVTINLSAKRKTEIERKL